MNTAQEASQRNCFNKYPEAKAAFEKHQPNMDLPVNDYINICVRDHKSAYGPQPRIVVQPHKLECYYQWDKNSTVKGLYSISHPPPVVCQVNIRQHARQMSKTISLTSFCASLRHNWFGCQVGINFIYTFHVMINYFCTLQARAVMTTGVGFSS
jgi:hypothetical protein